MSQEITTNASLEYSDSEGTTMAPLQATNERASVATKKILRTKQSVGTSEEAVVLGECTSPGKFMLKNLDPTNYIEVKTGTGGVVCGKMLAGESYGPVRLGSGMQSPYVIANTASCQMEVAVIQT